MGDDYREPLDLHGPVCEQRRRCHQQARPAPGFSLEHQQQGQHLYRLAKAHVVGKTSP
jgi:hypothetical protein